MRVRFSSLVLTLAALAGPAGAQWPVFLKDINPGSGSSTPVEMADVNGTLFFSADDGTNGRELWKSDGTAAGTVLVRDINPGPGSSNPKYMTNVNGTVFFAASDGVNGEELWKSDGTALGTVMVKDIAPGGLPSSPKELAAIRNTLFFAANDFSSGEEPWSSDGTALGTIMLADICPGSCSSQPTDPVEMGMKLYFGASHQVSLWETNGSPAGTLLVHAIMSGTAAPIELTVVGTTIFFQAFDSPTGFELWKSDGTSPGTVLVKDINPSFFHSSPIELTNVNGTLFFRATDGTNGFELWKSDGTNPGTIMVKDINPNPPGSTPSLLTAVKDRLFFAADDGTNGRELWESDGTAAGTFFRDLGSGASQPGTLLAVKDTLLFGANGRFGNELYKTRASTPGHRLVEDVNRGTAHFNPVLLTRSGPYAFFSGDQVGVTGRELWAFRVDQLHFFTVTSRDGENELEWVNPMDASKLQIRFRTDMFPVNENDGTHIVSAAGEGDAHEKFTHLALTNDQTYFYRAFADDGVVVVSSRTAKGRPENMSAGTLRWIYNTGAVATEPPGLPPVAILSNDQILHSVEPGDTGGNWPPEYIPFPIKAMAQGRPPVAPVSVGTASSIVLFSSNDGLAYAVDAKTGEYVWRSENLGLLQAIPAAMFTHFAGDYDLVFAGRRDASANAFYALALATGDTNWSFDNGGGLNGIGAISAMAAVEYGANRVYFTSRVDPAGSDRTVWCLSFSEFNRNLLWARGASDVIPIGEIDTSPTLRNGVLYVGTVGSAVHALDAATGVSLWSGPFMLDDGGVGLDGPVKSFVWAPRATNELFVSTSTTLWALADNGGNAGELWRTTAIPKPSAPLRIGRYLYVGGDDGRLYQIDLTVGPSSLTSVPLGDLSARAGAPSFDILYDMVYVGAESGYVYGFKVPY